MCFALMEKEKEKSDVAWCAYKKGVAWKPCQGILRNWKRNS